MNSTDVIDYITLLDKSIRFLFIPFQNISSPSQKIYGQNYIKAIQSGYGVR